MKPEELSELDCFLAECVMGWTLASNPSQIEEGKFFVHGSDVLISGAGNSLHIFNPTTDSADAMLVLEKCIEKVGWSRLIGFGSTAEGNYFVNHFDSEPGSEAFCTTEADTLPLAICLFAKHLYSK